ncbi:MAG: hypothetical protein II999_09245 [Bacteroidaceae bacterium]|nr:hypothetical protein [Bacteroidaceae bacterium]
MNKLNKLFAILFAVLGVGTTANADTSMLKESEGWQKITEIPSNKTDYYYALVDNNNDLMLTMGVGANQGSSYYTMYYKNSVNPLQNKAALWTIEGDNYTFRNSEYTVYAMQTEWNAAWNYRTHDQPNACEWTATKPVYSISDLCWTIQNGKYPDSGYLGPWNDANFTDGAEVAFNKSGNNVGKFHIYAIHKTYCKDVLAANATVANPVDMTVLMANRDAALPVVGMGGWTTANTITRNGSNGYDGKSGFFEFCNWGASSWEGSMTQTITSLPNGKYVVKAAGQASATDVVLTLTANGVSTNLNCIGASGGSISADGTEVTLGSGVAGWQYMTVECKVTDGTLTITANSTGSATQRWANIDNFSLTYLGADLDLLKEAYENALDAARSALENETYSAVIGVERTNLQELTEKVPTEDKDSYTITTEELVAATETFKNAKENYELLATEVAKAVALGVSDETINKYKASTMTLDAKSDVLSLMVEEYNHVIENFEYPVALSDTWISTGTNTSAATYDTEHWSGEKREYKNQYDSWGNPKQGFAANSWSIDFNQEVTLPAGEYVFKVAGRKSEATTLELEVTMGESTLGTVNDFPSTNDALGINKAGETSFDANDPAGFAKDGKGWGWQWRYVKFELDEEAIVKVSIHAEANTASQWVSFSDYTLQMTEETYLEANKGGVETAQAAAQALVDTKPMGDSENTALKAAIAMTYTTGAEMLEKVEALNAAVANANAWLATYNEAKAPLVAALERFETDYNDAENGALDYMNKSRWATAIEKAQAAAEAKDATDSYAGFADATAALVAALDAATVSVNEYASLKSAIAEAAAVSESEVNWGDAPFQRPESAQEGLNTAISAAESGYDAADADGEEVTALIDAMAVTLNAPQDAYCITVATDGHAYVDCPVVASLGSITDNNPTGYGLAAKKENEDLLAQLYTFTQVEGNKYRISVTVEGKTVYLTYGVLNDSQAGHKNWQIQGNTDIAKAGEFEVVASTTTEGVFRLRNTVTGTFLDCQDGGSIYTDDNITKDEFALTSATGSADINISADAKLGTCVLMFDAQLPDGLTAYVPESYDNGTTVLTLKMVTGGVLPAYTPCLLYAEGGYEGTLTGTVTMNGYAGKVTGDDGLLYGAIESQTITEGYILQKHDGEEVAKFYSVDGLEEEIPISAGKCWLTLANGVEEALETPAAVAFFFRGGGATKLNAVVMDKTSLDGAIYTLDGKRVNTMQRGEIYIINGQKVMVK